MDAWTWSDLSFGSTNECAEDPLFMMSRNNDEDCNNIETSTILTGENVPTLLLNVVHYEVTATCNALGSFSPFKDLGKTEDSVKQNYKPE